MNVHQKNDEVSLEELGITPKPIILPRIKQNIGNLSISYMEDNDNDPDYVENLQPIEVDGNISGIDPQNIQNNAQNVWANETNRDIHHHPQSTFHYYDDSVKGESDKNGILTFFFSTFEHF